jgi:hypothetical protein
MLSDITERTKIMRLENGNTAYFENDEWNEIPEDTIVSMNCWGLPEEFFAHAQKSLREFLESGGDEMKKEFYLPEAVKKYLADSGKDAKVLRTDARWYGVTYKEDRATVVEHIRRSTEDGTYPKNLWA